jgi:DNA-binding LacI/PurR family transcriptional regulator
LEDVARAAGVSRATASRALLEAGPASTPARARVRAVAERMRFRPDPAARALAGGPGTRIVIAVLETSPAELECGYIQQVAGAAAAVVDRHDVGVALRWAPVDGPGLLAGLATDRSVHGVILVNTTYPVLDSLPARLRGRVVSIGVGSDAVPSIDVDNLAGATAVLHHLCATRARIAMIEPPAWMPCALPRCQAYRQVMTEAGRPLRMLPGGFCMSDGRAGAVEVMRRWPDTDAIFAANDDAAFGAMSALREMGVGVPADVAVAGFDDVPAAALTYPGLTTASHPVGRVAAAAARALLDPAGGVAAQIRLPSELVLRESA